MPTGGREHSALLQGTLDMMILRTLAAEVQHGYGIARRIRQKSDDVLLVEEGSLYPALHRMERRRLISSTWKRSENNRRAKYYRLTPAGRRRLASDVAAWDRLSRAISSVMAGGATGATGSA